MTNMTISYMPLLVCFSVSFILTLLFARFPIAVLLDHAGDRSLHEGQVPRSGGIAIALSFVVGVYIYYSYWTQLFPSILFVSLGVLCLVSLWDDVRSITPAIRLLTQLVVAALVVYGAGVFFTLSGSGMDWLFMLITLLGIVWMINLYNFMDGMDGFAGGMALIGLGSFSVLGYLSGDGVYGICNLLIVCSVAGFLFWNLPPARIFMGDLGATLLGWFAAVSALLGVDRGVFPLWVPVVVFSPFWVDATYTLYKRLRRGEKVWQAHRSHIYQRLVLSGLSHRRVVSLEYGLMLLCSLSVILPAVLGVAYNSYPPIIWACIYILLIPWLEERLPQVKG